MTGIMGKDNRAAERECGRQARMYLAGIYARLSVDSHNEKNESIEGQMRIAKSWLEQQPDVALAGCYSDLGKSGTNFEREGFQRLMADVRQGKVNCVIVKDFSRFGRNYIETGNYIQKIFPFLGVRFVSVTDHYDSLYAETDSLGTNLKNLANEMYAHDIGMKVKSAKKALREAGSYTGGIPPYGYRAEWEKGRKRLWMEEEASGIVKEIYRLWREGKSMREVAEWLYQKKVHSPKDYRHYGHVFRKEGETLREWSGATLRLILTNPVYMGGAEDISPDGAGEQQFLGKGHQAMVTREQFRAAARRFGSMQEQGGRKEEAHGEDIFEGLLFCGECGGRMGRTYHVRELASGGRQKEYGYFCRRSARMDSFACGRKYITGQVLWGLVGSALRQEYQVRDVKTQELLAKFCGEIRKRKKVLEKELQDIRKKEEMEKRKGSELYQKYRSGEAAREVFVNWREKEEKEAQKYREGRENVMRKKRKLEDAAREEERFLKEWFLSGEFRPDRELLAVLVDKIYIFPDKGLEINFRFRKTDFGLILPGAQQSGGADYGQTI